MGWCESPPPPLFCSGSETARDIMELLRTKPLPSHAYEVDMLKDIVHDVNPGTPTTTTTFMELYVDDFITTTYNNSCVPCFMASTQSSLHQR